MRIVQWVNCVDVDADETLTLIVSLIQNLTQ